MWLEPEPYLRGYYICPGAAVSFHASQPDNIEFHSIVNEEMQHGLFNQQSLTPQPEQLASPTQLVQEPSSAPIGGLVWQEPIDWARPSFNSIAGGLMPRPPLPPNGQQRFPPPFHYGSQRHPSPLSAVLHFAALASLPSAPGEPLLQDRVLL